MRALAVVAVLLSLLAVAPQKGQACWVCDKPADLAAALKRSPVVFTGTVKSLNSEVTTFQVLENFGEEIPREVVMDSGFRSCDFRFVKGHSYLIFTAKVGKHDLLFPASECNRTAAIDDAAEDLAALRAQRR